MLARALGVIERNTALQSRLVDDLLDVSRAAAGKLSIDSKLVDLGASCAAAVEIAAAAAREKNITVEVARLEHPRIWGDPDRLQQVLWNVLSNAVKFSESGGRVVMSVVRDGSRAVIEVRDEGAGVSAEFLPHMFDRFRQGDMGMTRRQGGLGLGLTIVREIMTLHGGTASAHSAGPRQGTSIRLEFAVAEEPQPQAEMPGQPLRSKSPVH
jgi:signal transduction histidine kinase